MIRTFWVRTVRTVAGTGPSGCPGQTRHGLQQQILSRQVSIRAILAVSRRRGVNDPGVDALDVVVP